MSRRRNYNDPYNIALSNLNGLETRVINATVPIAFTIEDVLQWLFEDDIITLCRKAHQVADLGVYRRSLTAKVRPNLSITLDMNALQMMTPQAIYVRDQVNPVIDTTLAAMREVEMQFNRVRAVLAWCRGLSATTVKYYFPGICALLPPDSPVHTAKGTPREPSGLATMLPDLRDGAGIVASALMCPMITVERTIMSAGFWQPSAGSGTQARWHAVL